MEKQTINLVDIKKFLKDKKWEELTEEEQLEVSEKIAQLISQK